jgi:alanine racemase
MIAAHTRTWIEINASAFHQNLTVLKHFLGHYAHLALMLEADAYGHGLIRIASLAQRAPEIDMLCVETVEDALHLRTAGITKSIMILNYQSHSLVEALQAYIQITIDSISALHYVQKIAQQQKIIAHIHLLAALDITHLGLQKQDIEPCTHQAFKSPFIKLISIYTQSPTVPIFSRPSYPTIIRVGPPAYGLHEYPELSLLPILTWKTHITHIRKIAIGTSVGYNRIWTATRPTTLALLPIGYYDGYPRGLSNNASCLINSCPAPIVGLISMNITTVDITDIPSASYQSEVILVGTDPQLTSCKLAQKLESPPAHLTIGINSAIPRIIT